MKKLLKNDRLFHLLIWLLIIIPKGFGSLNVIEKTNVWVFTINLILQNGLLLAIIYINLLVLIPKFYNQNKRWQYYFWIILLVSFQCIFAAYWDNYFYISVLKFPAFNWLSELPFYYFNAIQYVVISFLLNSAQERFLQKKQIDEMQVEKLNAEVNYLKAQINPHFLFNTLNNLYALSLEKSDNAPATILMLSKMMDYMLFETSESKVDLQKDIENIENYIGLERIRQGNDAKINFEVKGKITHQKIVPLLLLPLIENAFKHGINQLIHGAYVNILIEIEQNSLQLLVENNYKINAENLKNHGIGLVNLKKQLEVFYKNEYELAISKTENLYQATLKLNLG